MPDQDQLSRLSLACLFPIDRDMAASSHQRNREWIEAEERRFLAPYAQMSADSAGRSHDERQHPIRTDYQRDKARIIHSMAFRRLEYKTQVFLNGSGDHLRTRLTHTIEVASVSRSIARALGLNEDLTEAIALAHDLGHSPFGHSGEETLDRLMNHQGGFEHNAQSLRIVELVEKKYPSFPGLNLTFEVLEGLRKHQRFFDPPPQKGGDTYHCPSLEAQVANLADEITYYSHDLDDGLDARLLEMKDLEQLTIWQETASAVGEQFPDLTGALRDRYIIRCMIDRQVADVVQTSAAAIEKAGVQSVDAVRKQPRPLIQYSQDLLKANRQLRKFLYANMYYHPRVHQLQSNACEMLKSVFTTYVQYPNLLGDIHSERVEKEGLFRTVCDYIAGMTDRYLLQEYHRLYPTKPDSPFHLSEFPTPLSGITARRLVE